MIQFSHKTTNLSFIWIVGRNAARISLKPQWPNEKYEKTMFNKILHRKQGLSKTNITDNREWKLVLRMGVQFLLHCCTGSVASVYWWYSMKTSDIRQNEMWLRDANNQVMIATVKFRTDVLSFITGTSRFLSIVLSTRNLFWFYSE